ncbi:TetR/AcrR family transcriptional regulator [Nocardia barduliensis]|uniref:TetR/AcrR family transcriptional regulator n=1 Tax=Nocardia barduliensis TaxID=2736643 RepID=UPI0015720A77|nr:TetR/AcrR family transcriptional regulator [Nocardia barduliensis]
MSGGGGRTARSRRTGDEVRARLVEAACAVFAEQGYAGASTKEIAQRAEVTEVLLFRHFGNKAGLFDCAVLDPFEKFVEQWTWRWSSHGIRGESVTEQAREYVTLLYEFFDDNRRLVTALLAARTHRPETAERLESLFARLERTVREGVAEYGLPTRDPAITVRLTFGMVLSVVIHADLLFPGEVALSRAEAIEELTRYVLHGVAHPDR